MAFWDRKEKENLQAIKLQNELYREKQETTKLKIINKMVERISTQMRSFRSFPDEMYATGVKQGQYAGLMVGNNRLARDHSRAALNVSPVAGSITNTISTLTVGSGLGLEAQPIWRLIPDAPTDEARTEWSKTSEAKYGIWAKKKSIAYDEQMNRFQQEQKEFGDLLVDGEYFEIYRYSANTKTNPLTIQIIRAEDVRNPSGSVVADGNTQEDGIEYNSKGAPVAYHVYNYSDGQTVRVLKKGPRSGRIFVNHVKLGGNRRGIGILAPMITELMKLGDYEVLELQAAVVNALYAVWVESPEGEVGVPVLNAAIGDDGQASSTTVSTEEWINNRKEINYNEGGLQIDTLPGGYKIQSHDTKRPNVNFGNFMDQVKKNLYASRGMPISVVDKQFKNNYSASRGELILAWYEIEKFRFNQSMTNDLVYRMWLWGEIQQENIIAPGFFLNEEIQYAWSNAKWIGNQRPDIDPLKSVNANVIEHNRGFKTGKQIAAERGGGDYDENLTRCKTELADVAEMQVPFVATEDVDLTDQ